MGDFTNWDVLEGYSSSKAYPQLHHTQAAKMSNGNDDNITVDGADESFRMTLLCGVRKMQKYPAISLLVIAWHDRVEVSHRSS